MKKIIIFCSLISFLFFLHFNYCSANEEKFVGYNPIDQEYNIIDKENLQYKKWCEEIFEYGEDIYDAYKSIVFIQYIPELEMADIWQTPKQTVESGKGDCEDVAFLCMDYLSRSKSNVDIVWGWVCNKKTCMWFAHVWCEIIGRDGEKYVIEGSSGKWNGIIPIHEINKFESRDPIFKLSCKDFRKLYNLSSCNWMIDLDTNNIFIFEGIYPTYSGDNITNCIIMQKDNGIKIDDKKEVKRILEKLQGLFLRMKE